MDSYLNSVNKLFKYYKSLGEQSIAQLKEEELFLTKSDNENSIAVIVKHIHGNMMSRWTDFRNSDGEKEWRDRDGEFEASIKSKEELMQKWEEGWACLFNAIEPLQTKDLESLIYIRNNGHTVMEAINRQLGHYAYHVGQMVVIAKSFHDLSTWKTLSIAKGQSKAYNTKQFEQEKKRRHFTDQFLKDKNE